MEENKLLNIAENRKKEHIKYFLKCNHINNNCFNKVILEHNSLPELNFDEIKTETYFLDKKLDFPLIINSITGGFKDAIYINEQLAKLAKRYKLAMAVGSQSIVLKSNKYIKSYKVVRDILYDGIVISNLSASCSFENALKAVEILEADAIQLHLNSAQEIFMQEGDRKFKGILNNIENIVSNLNIPVIVKEVGFGISGNAAKMLFNIGVRYIDVGGKGGTNFIEIENKRKDTKEYEEFYNWGIPTAYSLIECCKISKNLNIIASGGITKADEIVKSLRLGANIVGISGIILKKLLIDGYDETEKFIEDIILKTKIYMLLVGAENIEKLKKRPCYINSYDKRIRYD